MRCSCEPRSEGSTHVQRVPLAWSIRAASLIITPNISVFMEVIFFEQIVTFENDLLSAGIFDSGLPRC